MRERKRKLRLLLVESNPDDAKLALRVFQEPPEKWEVISIDNGQKALDFLFKQEKYAQAWTPDLVLLTLNLPALTGHEILRRVKQDVLVTKIPIVVWCISLRPEDIGRAYSFGASAYITKGCYTSATTELRAFRNFWEQVVYPTQIDEGV
jgi:CheY-like chemotaxis protein